MRSGREPDVRRSVVGAVAGFGGIAFGGGFATFALGCFSGFGVLFLDAAHDQHGDDGGVGLADGLDAGSAA